MALILQHFHNPQNPGFNPGIVKTKQNVHMTGISEIMCIKKRSNMIEVCIQIGSIPQIAHNVNTVIPESFQRQNSKQPEYSHEVFETCAQPTQGSV